MDGIAQTGAARLAARYGGDAPDVSAPANAVVDSILAHRSIRAFLPAPLADGVLETLVAAAQSAPTSSNQQAWSVVAVQDPARKARLAALSNDQRFIVQAPLFLCWIADLSRLDRLGAAHGRKLEGLEFLESYMVALVDAALAAQNAVVAAESLGLGTVYVGALRHHPEKVAEELGLPPNAFAVFGMSIGHPDPSVPSAVKPRLPQSLVLHHEQYAVAEEPARIAGYDARLGAFSQAVGMGRQDWTQRMLARVGTAAALSGRDRMREALAALGFKLR
ncbi:NADPH-dependent oxidoreductase [Falsiroseomonas bella]|uniref:NADPH-dependent oxidoreductase n=1 Tax=Falsiroseomonas bella TaxID=2184016 RepID=A0A317FL38_9PROT|nr:NADPH-dependent oxidoreductase [Falsiroseomonas bella]PWS38679.1 NADPH-dependent oxidoreductase [Falsiroseomonas bella]